MDDRIDRLIQFCKGIAAKEDGGTLYQKYKEDIMTVTPRDLMLIQYYQIHEGTSDQNMLKHVDKLINVFYKPLSSFSWKRPDPDSFIGTLLRENEGCKAILEQFKDKIKDDTLERNPQELKDFVHKVLLYQEHLLKLENILFPFLEKKDERYQGLKVLWTLHDQTRQSLKKILSDSDILTDQAKRNEALGELYFKIYGLMQKQELILFPCAVYELSTEEMDEMKRQSFEYGFPYIEEPEKMEQTVSPILFEMASKLFHTQTGHFDLFQLDAVLGSLPLDITLVDENDKVAYFSRPKERLFPRSAAVIGRDVRNCHPSDSVHVVEKILEAFKAGTKDHAEFWIQMKGRFIYIQYIPIRDEIGVYRGTLEMTQDITALRALEGEQRLLSWEDTFEGNKS